MSSSLSACGHPTRDEEESLPATVEHLHLEFSLNQVPREIMVVDNGSPDKTGAVLIREFSATSFTLGHGDGFGLRLWRIHQPHRVHLKAGNGAEQPLFSQ
jgi:glycosyltransferase involved in cell wall biosynthesis